MFALEKWYLDLVTADGTTVVCYTARLLWHPIRLHYAAILLAAPGDSPIERSGVGDGWPDAGADGLSWASAALDVRGVWRRLDTPVADTLLACPAGHIEWRAVVPRARAQVVAAGTQYDGLGYAECVRLTLAPWALPFSRLRWGRHLSDDHALVWIEWDGATSLRRTWLDGRPQADAHATSDGVDGLTGGVSLRWHDARDLCRRSVVSRLAPVMPALATRLGGRLGSMREHKQVSASSLVDEKGQQLDAGWAIHEEVTW